MLLKVKLHNEVLNYYITKISKFDFIIIIANKCNEFNIL